MPFKSEKQRKWMHANEPEMAKKWEKKKKNESPWHDIHGTDKTTTPQQAAKNVKKMKDKQKIDYLLYIKKFKPELYKKLRKNPKVSNFVKKYVESVNEAEKWKTVGIDVRDIYDYMVSIKKTNPAKFKKDMKNKALKGIWDRYSKGGEMYREGFGGQLKGKDKEEFEKARKENAEQLGYKLTGKSDIREAVKVRNGEAPMEGKWNIYDNSTGKAIKEVGNVRAATRLMNRLMSSGQYKEVAAKWAGAPVNEADIKDIEQIVKKKQSKKIGGVLVDMQTANAIMTVWKALNSSNRKKFGKLPIKKMAQVAWKLVK